MAQATNPTKPETVYPITAFTKSKTGKDRGALAKRFDHTVHINVDVATLGADALRALLLEALTNKARAAVKKLNPETATEEEIQAAMNGAVERIKAGKGLSGMAKPKMDEETKAIRKEGRAILRENIKARLEASDAEESLTGKQITAKISEYFKARDKYVLNPTKNAELKAKAQVVNRALDMAAQRIKERTEVAEDLGSMIEEMQNEPAQATAPKKEKAKPQAKPNQKGKEKGNPNRPLAKP